MGAAFVSKKKKLNKSGHTNLRKAHIKAMTKNDYNVSLSVQMQADLYKSICINNCAYKMFIAPPNALWVQKPQSALHHSKDCEA